MNGAAIGGVCDDAPQPARCCLDGGGLYPAVGDHVDGGILSGLVLLIH